jgi:hypothetical protein
MFAAGLCAGGFVFGSFVVFIKLMERFAAAPVMPWFLIGALTSGELLVLLAAKLDWL